jgi:hypothetical protein
LPNHLCEQTDSLKSADPSRSSISDLHKIGLLGRLCPALK